MENREKALIYPSELEYISRCVLDFPDIETGGDLFGFWTHSGRPVIHYAIGPGPDARRTSTFFNQDVQFLQKTGELLRDLHGLQHIGEWHSHHQLGLCRPSAHDCNTVAHAIADCGLPQFLLMICTIRDGCSDLAGFLFDAGNNTRYREIDWVVMQGENNLREALNKEMAAHIYVPKTMEPAIGKLNRTSLEETQYEKIAFRDGAWVSSPAGSALLKEIYTEVSAWNNTAKMKLLEDQRIAIVFCCGDHTHTLTFPVETPSPARIVLDRYPKRDSRLQDLSWAPPAADLYSAGTTNSQSAKDLIVELETILHNDGH